MNWCCIDFENRYKNKRKAGLSVFVLPGDTLNDGVPSFNLTVDMVDPEHKKKLKKLLKDKFIAKISLREQIHFCPWCGVNILKHYEDDYHHLHD